MKQRKVKKQNQLIKLEFSNSLFAIHRIQNLVCFVNEDSSCNALLYKLAGNCHTSDPHIPPAPCSLGPCYFSRWLVFLWLTNKLSRPGGFGCTSHSIGTFRLHQRKNCCLPLLPRAVPFGSFCCPFHLTRTTKKRTLNRVSTWCQHGSSLMPIVVLWPVDRQQWQALTGSWNRPQKKKKKLISLIKLSKSKTCMKFQYSRWSRGLKLGIYFCIIKVMLWKKAVGVCEK